MRLAKVLASLIVTALVASCGSAPTATPTLAPTRTMTTAPTLTATNVPTSTPRATETSTPTFTATPRPTATATATPCTTLRECADRKQIQIGTYLTGSWFPDPKFKEIVAKGFNLAVISSGFYWHDVEPTRGQFNLSFADEQVAFAQSKNMLMCGHALLLAESPYIPDWLAKGNFTRDDLAQLLRNYIVQVMSRYKGRIGMYLVVEDAPLPPDTQNDIFYQKFGYDYIDLAFQIARETDPSAVLIYNAGDNETSGGAATQLTRQIVQRLKVKGLVDGVGLEMHLDGTKPYVKQDVIATMRSYGVPVYVTEIDVDLTNVQGTQQERYAKQAKIYGDMFAACLESGVCKSFAVWGIGDKYSWLRRASPIADPTLFDDNLNPKPAYFALLDALR